MESKRQPKANQSDMITNEKLINAASMIRDNGCSIRSAADTCDLNRITLKKYFEKRTKAIQLPIQDTESL